MRAAVEGDEGISADILGADLEDPGAAGRDVVQRVATVTVLELGAVGDVEHAATGAAAMPSTSCRPYVDRPVLLKALPSNGEVADCLL